jgi:hypothetical protein
MLETLLILIVLLILFSRTHIWFIHYSPYPKRAIKPKKPMELPDTPPPQPPPIIYDKNERKG